MPELFKIPTFVDERGNLSVTDFSILPFEVKRLYYIYNLDNSERAKHRHKITNQFLICVGGSCEVKVHNGIEEFTFILNEPNKGLFLLPEDWHVVKDLSPNTILVVLASEPFDENDYIFDPYF